MLVVLIIILILCFLVSLDYNARQINRNLDRLVKSLENNEQS